MVSEGEIWKLEKNLCRCCHAEGTFDNLANEKDIYSDMLRYCFDIDVTPVPGVLCALTYTICPHCILKLRDASAFKKQVQLCEEKFLELYYKKAITVKGQVTDVKDEPDVYYNMDCPDELSPDDVDMEADDKYDMYDYEDDIYKDKSDEDDEKVNKRCTNASRKKKEPQKQKSRAKQKQKCEVKERTEDERKEDYQDGLWPDDEELDADDGYAINDDKDDEIVKEKLVDEEEKTKKRSSGTGRKKKEPQKEKARAKQRPKCQQKEKAEETAEGKQKEGRNCYSIVGDKYICKFCERTFASQPLVSQHYRFVHFKKRPRERKCPKCDEMIPGYQRAYHLEERHNIPAPKCGVCNRRFRYPHQVLRHQQKVHMGERRERCRVCGKGFFDGQGLKLHMATHSSVKKYSCNVCKRQFRWENNLKDHLRIHSGDRRYACRVCGRAFVQKSGLKRHGVRNHPGLDVNGI
ncbi:zinc finger and SCAN domain-containing protein 21-like isoform X2 [Zerene cesonia]|uniref:zinc finger and SCAN domain-containing protein 21-like isoform X2 n=1 Tax=Zerene cesonia TaxID=33412 RepID=UPI0018E5017C|nr:zinc finger and SCAN domain-containing protein 21-like isoform X2 [Zerene cesonia]